MKSPEAAKTELKKAIAELDALKAPVGYLCERLAVVEQLITDAMEHTE
jgi:hypothetical protein